MHVAQLDLKVLVMQEWIFGMNKLNGGKHCL